MDPAFQRQGNLHHEITDVVGRTRLLATLRWHLGESRLVTVTGIGGVGKSRTVLRLAHQVRSEYPDGVWFADLARLKDPGMIKHGVASALGIADQSSRAESESLAEWVGERDMLLIIDTCEHLVQGCAELVHELLLAAPNLKVLATSRQSLHLPYEHVVPVPPLQVPGEASGVDFFTNESVQLFTARAAASVPDFVLDERNIGVVAELCRRLDGIPLAIELAAVRLRALSVEQMLGLLADRFSLLTSAGQYALSRHATLRAAIDWSHELCRPAEQLLWARLSVFAGDFELDAAMYVCSDERLPSEEITDLVAGLVEKSILLMRSNRAGVRYRLIDTLAEYGEERLHKLGEAEQMCQRHLEYYLSLAQRSEDAWSGPRQIYWFVRMRQEYDNVRAVLDYALRSSGKSMLALQLLSSLWFMWVCCGLAREGQRYLERALDVNRTVSKERCKALWVLSYVRSAQGDSAGALAAAETCSTEAVSVGDSRAVILSSKMQGTAALLQGDLKKASALLGVAMDYNIDDKELNPGLLPAIVEQSLVLTVQGDLHEAETLLQDCLKLCKARGELWLSSHAQWALAGTWLAGGRINDALQCAREALRIKRHFNDTLGILLTLETLARACAGLDQPVLAARLFGAIQGNWRLAGLPMLGASWLTEEYESSAQRCRVSVGEARYDREFAAGSKLDLDAASVLALGDWEISDSARMEIRVADADDAGFAKVEDAVVQVVDAFGFEVPTANRSRSDRYVMKLRTDVSGVTVDERLEEMDRALRDEVPAGEGVQIGAVDALIAALEDVSSAVVLLEQTLLVKVSGTISSRRLSAAEQAHLGNCRDLFEDPTELMYELDQLAFEAELDRPRQVHADHREIIKDNFGEAGIRALESWADTANYEILVSLPPWERSGHTESRLLALIIKTPPGSDERTSKVVAKLCPPGQLSREPARHRRAWDTSPRKFRQEHLVKLKPHSPRIGDNGGYILLQEVAGGSFARMCQMERLAFPEKISETFHAVAKSMILEWNEKKVNCYSHIDSGEYLRSGMRGKFEQGGKLRVWAERSGLLRPECRWITIGDESSVGVLPNPVAMAAGDIVGRYNIQHLRGFAHGDLHAGNVLVPQTRLGQLLPDRFILVDLTTFEESAPLTMDLAMLFLSLVATRIPEGFRAEEKLIAWILQEDANDDFFAPMVRTLYDDKYELVARDFHDDWVCQLFLSLQAAALLHCTFGSLDERTRWWFFRLAARCGGQYLASTESWHSSDVRPFALNRENMAGFAMEAQ
ncbi:hypothetical protein GCM10022419_047290 [Nonomuraea rosea]|uniref:Protein kinase domain-containing protein n=1 Tax=Nonomuraea rosea TaxID=638574 RepID=A0ABP6X444_9ACTN